MLPWVMVFLSLSMMAQQQAAPQAQQSQPKNVAPRPAAAEFHIEGTMVDSRSGQPLAHTRVAIAPISQRDDFTTMVTGEDGRFVFSHLAPGKYTLTAQRRGYLTHTFNQHDQFASSIVVGP